MKRLFARLVLVAIVLAVIAFFAAPMVAFFAIRSAAEASDVQGLTRLIDFAAVRQSLRPQLTERREALTPPPSFLDDPIGAVRRQFENATASAGPNPDAYLTPAALSGLTRGEGRYASARTGIVDLEAAPWPRPVYWGLQRARMAVSDDGGSDTIFTFERRGPYEWKLVHIGLPDGATPTVTAPPAPGATTP